MKEVYFGLDATDDAIEILKKASELHRDEPRILSNLGLSYLLSNRLQKAESVFVGLIELELDYNLNQRLLEFSIKVRNSERPVPRSQQDIIDNMD